MIYTPGNRGRFHKQGRAEHRVPRGVPARVKPINEDTLKLMQIGRPFNELPSNEEEDKPEFMEFLRAWGGEWMWEDVQLNETPEWAAECLRTGDLVCVTDGSYNKKTAPDICSAGWVLASKSTRRYIAGTLVERSPWANSYRGELLGMLAIRLFLLALEEYCDAVSQGTGNFC